MATGPTSLKELPAPLRIGVILATGGGLMLAIKELPLWGGALALLGIALIGLLLVAYARLLKWHKARQARPAEQQMLRSGGAGQQGISDPEQLAKLDDLRHKFEEGIGKFRAAGKSLYSLPWLVILGEPGSGKTEAIRHCGIGFPGGLHDPYAGVGGTINMDWWFTDHGVVIDTAGRLMFEEAYSSGSREWREFLNLLRKWRRDCPINGALLVIPADSLICDDAEKIEKKASQIAQRFDMIQRTLDVRFPVYVVISKSDLINGFREFFAGISDPQLQHQILGWSNPGDMDKPYDPTFVDKYLEEMKTRLFRARLTRLGELLCEDAEEQDRPTAEALYAFPYAFEQLGPRLRRYLDLIFGVGSQWSCKPLFFRGIYFTSSMQEGAALDEDLARALGVPVASLPEGRVWKRDRAHFLRDLFVNKVFPERGLVTRATNARKQYARRQAAVLGSAAVGLVLLLALTIYGSYKFAGSVRPVQRLLGVAVSPEHSLKIIDPYSYEYQGEGELGKDVPPRYGYFAALARQANSWKRHEGIPWIFWWAVADISTDLAVVAQQIYVADALQPLVSFAADKMTRENDRAWGEDSDAGAALCQLLHLLRTRAAFDAGSAFRPLMRYAYPDEFVQHPDHWETLAGSTQSFQTLTLSDPTLIAEVNAAVEHGIQEFNKYWSGPREGRNRWDGIRAAVENVSAFEKAELELIAIANRPDAAAVDNWLTTGFNELEKAQGRVQADKGALTCASLARECDAVAARLWTAVQVGYERPLGACGAAADANRPDSPVHRHYQALTAGREQRRRELQDPAFRNRLAEIDKRFWEGNACAARFSVYQAIRDCLKALQSSRQNITIERLADSIDAGRKQIDRVRQARSNLKGDPTGEVEQVTKALLRYGEREFYRSVVDWWLIKMPEKTPQGDPIDLGDLIKDMSKSGNQYDPNTAPCVFAAWEQVKKADLDPNGPQRLKSTAGRLDTAYRTYVRAYVRYWQGEGGCKELDEALPQVDEAISRSWHWRARRGDLGDIAVNPRETIRKLRRTGESLRQRQEWAVPYLQDNALFRDFVDSWNSVPKDNEPVPIVSNWYRLPEEPQAARQVLLRCKLDVTFLKSYFGTRERPSEASPDYYWYRLAITSLDLLVQAVEQDVATKLRSLGECRNKFPFDKDRDNDVLTAAEVKSIYTLFDELFEEYPPGTIGEEKRADRREGDQKPRAARDDLAVEPTEIDEKLQSLRDAVAKAAWIRGIEALPRPGVNYWCHLEGVRVLQAGSEKIDMGHSVRRVVIRQGRDSRAEDRAPIDYRENSVPNWDFTDGVRSLSYTCAGEMPGDGIALEFYDLPAGNSRWLNPGERPFSAPWAWHRMLKDAAFDENKGYILLRKIQASSGLVAVEMTLRFSREKESGTDPKGSKPKPKAVAIFPFTNP
ncbi:MAG: hypothetical protein MUC88_06700 [Planctomycetes bacterium]|nr:hypothetical protein [Planctomycetota bacterium]